MFHDLNAARRAAALHRQEAEEKAAAAHLPEGEERDRLRMHAERLSDEAWSIEETSEIDFSPSGLWPKA